MFRLPQLPWIPEGLRPCVDLWEAEQLAGVLAARRPASRRAAWLKILRASPGLCLWAILGAQRDRTEPRDVFGCHDWLQRHSGRLFLDTITWEPDASERDHWRSSLAAARCHAGAVWQQASIASPAEAHASHFAALLYQGDRWLRLGRHDRRWSAIPDWLRDTWQHHDSRADGASARCDPSQREGLALRAPVVSESDPRVGTIPSVLVALAEGLVVRQDFHQQLEQRKRAAVREFAYGAGHELNNPLAIIAARAQSLAARTTQDPVTAEEQQRILSNIQLQTERAHAMIADLMLYAKPPEPRWEPVALDELVSAWVERAADRTRSRAITVESVVQATPCLSADRVQLESLVGSLLSNAQQAVESGGWIGVSLECLSRAEPELPAPGPWIRLAVEDDGPGLGPREREHLFDPFFSGREAGRGLGFGLCKSEQIVAVHRGLIRAESSPRGGCRMVVELPCSQVDLG